MKHRVAENGAPSAGRIRPGIALAAAFAICLAMGWSLSQRPATREPGANAANRSEEWPSGARQRRFATRHAGVTNTTVADPVPTGAIAGEAVLRFASAEALERFLANPPRGLKVLGFEPRLRAVRVSVADAGALDALRKSGETGVEFNFIVAAPDMPDPREIEALGPAAPFGNGALDWLGAADRPGSWGRGVKVAVLDSGVQSHPALAGATIRSFDLLGGAAEGDFSGHGTAVASLLAGTTTQVPGVAPGVEILDLRILDGNGHGDTFTLATGILRAVDLGAQVISLSLGTYGDSPLVRDAVAYALSRNVALVAAAGNEGLGGLSYPARYSGVIAVSAVDASGALAPFSNAGEGMSVAAPGAALTAAWSGGQFLSFSGTSASVPLVAGAIAYVLADETHLSPAAAAQTVLRFADEAGAPGADPEFGSGVLDLGWLRDRRKQGVFDLAVASHWLAADDAATVSILVTIQNRGTVSASAPSIDVTASSLHQTFRTPYLAPGATATHRIEIPTTLVPDGEPLAIQSRVQRAGITDARPANNTLRSSLRINP